MVFDGRRLQVGKSGILDDGEHFNYCQNLTKREQDVAVSIRVSGECITDSNVSLADDPTFRSGVEAKLLLELNISDVHQIYTKTSMPAELEIHIYINESMIDHLQLSFAKHNMIFLTSVRSAVMNLTSEYCHMENVTQILSRPECRSLFETYLWVGLAAVAVLIVVISVGLACFCCKRGKTIQLQTDKPVVLPSIYELPENLEYSGVDNPALVMPNEEIQKKKAPVPPTSTPDMATFGKDTVATEENGYETGISPYNEVPVPVNSAIRDEMEVQDTKL